MMIPEVNKSPLNLAKWALQSVENRTRSSNFQVNSRFAIDPRISHERRIQLQKAFDEIDKDKSGKISYEEIYNYLKEINDEADENYVRTIFDSMDANHDGQVSIDEFLGTYLEQVNGISEAIARLKQQIAEKKKDHEGITEQFEEAKRTERINSWGIMEGSILTVRVAEAQNLSVVNGKPSAYVNLLCERQQISTKVIKNDRNPVWDETFTFKISVGTGELLVQTFNEGTVSKDDLLGTSSISLQEFKDQKKHERWLQLAGRNSTARVSLTIQWIHKKTDYLESIKDELERDITADTAEVTRLENEMKKLGTNPLGMFRKESWLDKLEAKIVSEVEKTADRHFHTLGNLDIIQRIMLGVFTLLAVFTSFTRPDLANLTWAGAIWSRELGGWTLFQYRVAGGTLLALFIYDFLWVFGDLEYLVFALHEDPRVNLYRFSFIMGFFNFILKALLFIIMVKSYISARDKENQKILAS
ncbi:hypothetical protein SteCoe_34618 [Stentor coeruleus]|uniref:Calmodulin n=1 Tax=Stentor coeruleus TaxID=5963 RepID=A0A1R2AU63_9CILI|nr:hypothetical protein SteCoe_34618 [Stentor coeruleus]